MRKKNLLLTLPTIAAGLIMTLYFRAGAIAENAANSAKLTFALGLIVLMAGLCGCIVSALPQQKKTDTHTLVTAALFAALCYIGFTFFKFDIPVGTEKTAFHLGNVFCVLAALLLGGVWGGMAGAVGMTIADLTTAYVTSAPKTFLLKLCIGLIVGFFSHQVFHIQQNTEKRRVPLPVAVVLSSAAGMAFNIVADPVVGYFYKTYLLGVPQDAAKLWAKIGAVTTSVNAVIAVIVASALYLAIRKALQGSHISLD